MLHLIVLRCFCLQDEDKKVQLTVLNDRSQGGTSLSDGEVELMVSEGGHNGGSELL